MTTERKKEDLKLSVHDSFIEEATDLGPSNDDVLGIAFYSFLIFTIFQTCYALRANSYAMMADSAAMFVDAGTYLCNLMAERLKNRTHTEAEKKLPPRLRQRARKRLRLYAEFIPPFISATTLLCVTFVTLGQSITTLRSATESVPDEDSPDLKIMLIFAALNLVLDAGNVICFARVDRIVTPLNLEQPLCDERTLLLEDGTDMITTSSYTKDSTLDDDDLSSDASMTNLNMCSAWTHVLADTLRSIAVLVAGGLAFYFNIISASTADAMAALIVSFIIFFSCVPLLKGLYNISYEIFECEYKIKEAC